MQKKMGQTGNEVLQVQKKNKNKKDKRFKLNFTLR